MIRLKVLDILKNKGKTKYWLYNQMGLSYKNFNRLVTNETISIRFENIELLCNLLDCSPSDLFEIIPDEK
ncbi:MAG: helix-turn-helix transcriptional regulator [Hespellia sp.]|nr:helix-turn-helix transcriptional regulator [Hespellia sp.]